MSIKEVKKEKGSQSEDNIHPEISRSVRTARPGNYLFKIESFSLLTQWLIKTKADKYNSDHFEAGGYKWKLSLYPNGDKKRDGDGYISLYLSMAEPNSLPQGCEVNAIFKFFVFDHVHDSYLTLQDGKDRRFHALKTEWGFAKLLPLNVFNDASNGYLIGDSCAFGVEIFFHKNEWNTGSLRIINESHDITWTWKVDKFSTLTQQSYDSDVLKAGGHKWILKVYPNGDSRGNGKSVSLFLSLDDLSSLPSGSKIYVEYTLSIKNQANGEDKERTGKTWFSSTARSWGFNEFLALSDLNNASNGFILNDIVIVEGKIIYMVVKS